MENNNVKNECQSIVLMLNQDRVNIFKAALSARLAKLYDEYAKLLAAGKVSDSEKVMVYINHFNEMFQDLDQGNDIKTNIFNTQLKKTEATFENLIDFLSSEMFWFWQLQGSVSCLF